MPALDLVVIGREDATQRGADAEDGEVRSRDHFTRDALSPAVEVQVHGSAITAEHGVENLIFVPKIAIHGIGQFVLAVIAAVVEPAAPEGYELLRILDWKQTEHQLVDQSENSGVRSDTQRQRQDRHRDEHRRLAEGAQCVAEIGNQISHMSLYRASAEKLPAGSDRIRNMYRRLLFCLLSVPLLAQTPAPKKPGLPLKPERKIEFTTDEATWLSLTLTPDGKTIIFELLGDLYSLPVTGGEAKPVTTGLAFDSQPSVSPDGKKIAFVSDRDGSENLWICNLDGSDPKQLSKDAQGDFISPSWTPDGDYVLVSRKPADGLHEVWMYNIQGGSGVRVTKSSPTATTTPQQRLRALGAVASGDGKYFYFARRTGNFTYNTTFPLWQVVRRDRVTGDEDVITSAPGSAFRPVISPDGSKLVFGTRQDTETGMRVRDLASGEEKWLRYPVQRDDQESAATRDVLPGYAFTPDSKDIIISYGGKIHRVQISTGEASDIPFSAKVSQDLGPLLKFESRVDEGPVKARLIQTPSESPDGKHIVFSSLTHLYKLDDGGKAVRLTSTNAREFQPAWSPDGQWIVYATWDDNGGDLWKIRSDGSGSPTKLTRVPAFYRDPVWSTDSKRVVALRQARQARLTGTNGFAQSGIGMDVVWVPADGGDATLIVPARGTGRPHFTHDAERIYVYSNQGLQSFRWDGTDRRTVIKVEGKSRNPQPTAASDVRISPDGKHALAKLNEQLFLIAMPAAGGDTPTINVNTPSVPVKKLTTWARTIFNGPTTARR